MLLSSLLRASTHLIMQQAGLCFLLQEQLSNNGGMENAVAYWDNIREASNTTFLLD